MTVLVELLADLAKELGQLDGRAAHAVGLVVGEGIGKLRSCALDRIDPRPKHLREAKLMLTSQPANEFEHLGV